VRIAKNSPSLVATEVVWCLVALIDVSDEEFLAHESVCVSISKLGGSFHGGLDDEYCEALMELLFNVAATTKVRRVLLNLWFNLDALRSRDVQSVSDDSFDVCLSGMTDSGMIFRFSMRYWKISLLKDILEILQRQDCCILSNLQTMEMNWKSGYFPAI
jgi:hypothetical protein